VNNLIIKQYRISGLAISTPPNLKYTHYINNKNCLTIKFRVISSFFTLQTTFGTLDPSIVFAINTLSLGLKCTLAVIQVSTTRLQLYGNLKYIILCEPFWFLVRKMREEQFIKRTCICLLSRRHVALGSAVIVF
jgi:hypothetical protein